MLPRALVIVLALASSVLAQCPPANVNFTPYGSGCSGFGQPPPSLTGFYLHGTCYITLTLTGAVESCPGFCLVQKLVAVGVTPTSTPLGVVACDLLVEPIFVVSLPPGAGHDFVFNLPPFSIAGLQVYVHGGNIFSTPSGYVYEVSNGLHADYF